MIFKRTSTDPYDFSAEPGDALALSELEPGEEAVLESVELPGPAGRRLMELGFLPGNRVTAMCSAPGGDPLVFGVDGAQVALRRETAAFLKVRKEAAAGC